MLMSFLPENIEDLCMTFVDTDLKMHACHVQCKIRIDRGRLINRNAAH